MTLRRVRHKPKMTVVLTKSARFDETIMAEGAHGSYANDDEDTYEDADYSDAAFQDPRVPDVGEGDINQVLPTACGPCPDATWKLYSPQHVDGVLR